jgi:hypothetical protein
VIDRFMRVLDWVAFPLMLFSAFILAFTPFVLIDYGLSSTVDQLSRHTPLHLALAAYILIKAIIYVVQSKWRWFPWSK